ncbi:MAG: hypothetical protein Q9223_005982 [Gallowayella weberi]
MGIKDCYATIPRQWKFPKAILYLFAVELIIEIAALALYGIAQPDLYRTKLWQEGSDHGWNSNPNSIIYDYANYRPSIVCPTPNTYFSKLPSAVPTEESPLTQLWNRNSITNFNVVIAVLSLFLLLCKGIMYICHVFHPIFSTPIHAALVALYAVSIHAQSASDMSDPDHPQPGAPWYITKSCGAPVKPSLQGYCKQAKGSFAVTIMLCALFSIYLVLSLYSLLAPTSAAIRHRKLSTTSSDLESQQRPWEMTHVQTPPTPGGLQSPMTPRTTAFNTLSGKMGGTEKKKSKLGMGKGKGKEKEVVRGPDGKVPLRHHISMGDAVYEGPSGKYT